MAESQPSRRGFLKIATAVIGGIMGAIVAVPLVQYLFFPVGRRVVDSSGEPVDALDEQALEPGADPVRVQINAQQRNAWGVSDDVPLGAAWVRKDEAGKIVVLSSLCPHLGCAINFDATDKKFTCPCHKSAFALNGDREAGPSKRGLDDLPHEVADGRIKITFKRYRTNVAKEDRDLNQG